MTESPLVIVDTNMLLDVTGQDERWADWSQGQIAQHGNRVTKRRKPPTSPILPSRSIISSDIVESLPEEESRKLANWFH